MTLRIEDISVRYGEVHVLSGINFSLAKGEIVCIIGPNGSGKSTLIKTIAGILESYSGNLFMQDKNFLEFSRNEIAKKIGYVPQDFHYLTSASVLEAVILGRRPHVQWSLSPADLNKVHEAMQMLSIDLMSEKMLTELSGGERQRGFIARALAQEPEFFLFDEPTSALDIRHQIEVFEIMKTITRKGAGTVLVAVHDLNFAYHYADRVILLDKGKIVQMGTSPEVMTEENITSVYGVPMQFITTGKGRYVLPDWPLAGEKKES